MTAAGLVPRTWTFRPEAGTATQNFALSLTFQEEITVGSRAVGVEAEKAVPVDILTARQIETAGYTETMQVIQALAPSFNFPRTTIADGSASVRPATLRGLGPDQILVLLNGKRRHNTALVHVNGTVGRGSTGVDLNAIPVSAIERVEILRDGAAAQYGSDAIAGVINIVLKSGKAPLTLSAKAGRGDDRPGRGRRRHRRRAVRRQRDATAGTWARAGCPRPSSTATAAAPTAPLPTSATRSARATASTTPWSSRTTGSATPTRGTSWRS